MLHKLHGNCNEVTQAATATWQTLMKLHGNFNEKKSMYWMEGAEKKLF